MIEIKHRVNGAVLKTVDAADLRGANLRGANLQRADLQRADLQHANLCGADLQRANLYGVDLQRADLQRADLRGANLYGANLHGADLQRANLRGADLQGAIGIIAGGAPNGWHAHGWIFEGYLSIRVGCQEKRLKNARKYWANKPHRREVLAAVEYIAAVAEIRGWRLSPPKKK